VLWSNSPPLEIFLGLLQAHERVVGIPLDFPSERGRRLNDAETPEHRQRKLAAESGRGDENKR